MDTVTHGLSKDGSPWLTKRALALRLVFDAGASTVLSQYKRRMKELALSLRRKGYVRLHRFVCNPFKHWAWYAAGAMLLTLYYKAGAEEVQA